MDKIISAAQIDIILKYIQIFESKDYVFGKPIDFTFVDYSEDVDRFISDLYENGFIIDFGWVDWQEEAFKYYESPEKLKFADLKTIQKLLTTHVRKDRFVTGHLLAVLEDGYILAILKRLEDIKNLM